MPREADPQLEQRILEAARKLWHKGGDKILTMRAVALAAGTTTPTLYERFKDRGEILSALSRKSQQSLFAALRSSRTPQAACQRYLEFALTHPNEYELVLVGWGGRVAANRETPNFDLFRKLLAKSLGGSPEQWAHLAAALFSQLHGTAKLLNGEHVPEEISRELRRCCLQACNVLLENAPSLSLAN
jgi:AcrR family transcriptional regulator